MVGHQSAELDCGLWTGPPGLLALLALHSLRSEELSPSTPRAIECWRFGNIVPTKFYSLLPCVMWCFESLDCGNQWLLKGCWIQESLNPRIVEFKDRWMQGLLNLILLISMFVESKACWIEGLLNPRSRLLRQRSLNPWLLKPYITGHKKAPPDTCSQTNPLHPILETFTAISECKLLQLLNT